MLCFACFWTGWQKLFVYVSCISAFGEVDQYHSYWNDMQCTLMPGALEININGELKQACRTLLFNHQKYFVSITTTPIATKHDLTYREGSQP